MESDAGKMERFQMLDKYAKNKTQAQRFIDAAVGAEADESPDALDRIMGKLDLAKKPSQDRVVDVSSRNYPDTVKDKKGIADGK